MQKRCIMLASINDVEEFVNNAEKCDFNINVSKSQFRFMVDGKSILGMLAISGKDKLDVEYEGEDTGFIRTLEKFQVNCN